MENRKDATVLLVDDEQEILQALRRRFRREEFTLLTAGSEEEALEILTQRNIQVLLSDARMPGIGGIRLLEEVKRRYPEIVRMIFSGYVDSESLIDAINKGEVFRFITKPWDEEELKGVIYEGIAHYRTMQLNSEDMGPILAQHASRGETGSGREEDLIISDSLVEEIPRPTVCIDEEGRIRCVNGKFAEIFGMNREEIAGTALSSHLGAENDRLISEGMHGREKQLRLSVRLPGGDVTIRIRPLRRSDSLSALLFIEETEGDDE